MQSILHRGKSFFTSTPPPSEDNKDDDDRNSRDNTANFKTIASPNNLFSKVDPRVDGEECLHDCATCTVRYPAKFDIDTTDKLYGNVDGWAAHLIVATGKTDWVRDVADEKGSLMEAVDEVEKGVEDGDKKIKLKVSASNMPVPDEYHQREPGEQPTNVLLLPSFTIVEHVTPQLVPDLIRSFVILAPTTTTPLELESFKRKFTGDTSRSVCSNQQQPTTSTLQSRPCPHSAVILLCSQRTRDARCGQSAPLLRREFERHLRPLGLQRDLEDNRPGGVGIYFISHVGGHKYAANVIVYRRRDLGGDRGRGGGGDGGGDGDEGATQGIWLARVRPEDCENIVKYTVLKGKVVKPEYQLRGGFDRERGVVSW